MFLVNSRLGLFSAALRHSFSLSYGVFLPSSLRRVLPLAFGFSPRLPVSVCGTGTSGLGSGFSWQRSQRLRLAAPLPSPLPARGFAYVPFGDWLDALYQPRAPPTSLRPRFPLRPSVVPDSLPVSHRLRSRLGLGPDLPWVDDPSPGILRLPAVRFLTLLSLLIPAFSLPRSPASLTLGLLPAQYAPLPRAFSAAPASVACFSPVHFRRRTSRPVSCYALFKCMAASKPTSRLSSKSHFLSHLTCPSGP